MPKTTEDLRAILFDSIESVQEKKMDPSEARAICALSDQIISSAMAELEYARTLSKLDYEGQSISPGPYLLTQ